MKKRTLSFFTYILVVLYGNIFWNCKKNGNYLAATTKHTKYTKHITVFLRMTESSHIFVYFVCFVVNNYEK